MTVLRIDNKEVVRLGAKAWFIAYFDDDPKSVLAAEPKMDREESRALAERLFPNMAFTPTEDGALGYLNPDENQVFVGCYGGVRIIAHEELAIDCPTEIDPRWLDPSLGTTAYVHATHSVVDWFAFGLWREGKVIRALSISPDNGIMENVGDPLSFEKPYWDGQFPVDDDDDDDDEPYPLPFHPLELAEESLLHHLGFQFEGQISDWVCEPYDVPIANFSTKRHRQIWKFW